MMTESRPLAEILRPKTLDEVIGQTHLVGGSGVIRKFLASGFLPSMIFWGPPGCGKTSLAHLLASLTNAYFESHSAVSATLADVRRIVSDANLRLAKEDKRTVFFLDEIHRFNKAQQDALLPHVEKGTVIFIGATTENPSFEVISPLLSRCRVFVLNPLSEPELNTIIDRGLVYLKHSIAGDARTFLLSIANGDARSLFTILEIASELRKGQTLKKNFLKRSDPITLAEIEQAAQRKMLQYDRAGEEHYNTISAFIKSMRASDIDAALYYLARMVAAGEDPLFIARRMVIFASEDIGIAQPTALVVANAVFDGCHKVGYPEAQILLAHGVAYLCLAKKDRSAYDAYFRALDDVKKLGNLPIPLSIRNAPTKFMKGLGYGKGYDLPASATPKALQAGKYTKESLLPDKIKGKKYYIK
ncbi:MAG: ATPase the helicase subunit of the Holliday junction resolvase [Candidatus Gottesmanbacteria bacterium GW2011_GWA2_47_9]|uniref:ATPase the helicase subunit of the Holliday junction resolvase n=3 Tax=Candidatus Gottesmaniibacteriota TaxID=1752720 RepID=A0A0G1WYN2_9BACT|nr:MAG: ATPase the helicase subunit of the Holliday junction resolvase [Candidatus Gottesmanbacteria bacterium GW2011_GWA2_47_9]KKU95423.1 MAG: ATPase the helicase subunit of the Holliday junction resolvase [Candidatus Gottesmanbacteria bacterium GW2011_GWA1_48_13]